MAFSSPSGERYTGSKSHLTSCTEPSVGSLMGKQSKGIQALTPGEAAQGMLPLSPLSAALGKIQRDQNLFTASCIQSSEPAHQPCHSLRA